jgi:hypothetical protein
VPPPPGVRSPALWGTEQRVRELFDGGVSSLRTARRQFTFRYPSPQHWLDVFRTYYGPMVRAFAALEADQQERLAQDLLDLARRGNRAVEPAMAVPSEYLEVVAVRS